jgi:hypothetical protein
MKKERKVTKEFISANMFDVDIHHNGYQGGDAGHGGFVDIKFKNFQDTSLEVSVLPSNHRTNLLDFDTFEVTIQEPKSIQLIFKGDTERDTLVEALEFIVKELKENK